MILFKTWLLSTTCYLLLPVVLSEENGPSYDTSDWIPIVPDANKETTRESKSSDRILNVGLTGEKFIGEEKFPIKKTHINPHKLRKNPHIKRSPNHRPRIKLDQPYRFENVLSPPPKQQLRGFQQKIPYQQQTFSFQPQYQFNIPKSNHIVTQQSFQQFPHPSNPSIYNLQAGPSIPTYTQLGVSYQQPNFIQTSPTKNNSILGHSTSNSVHQGLFETTASQNLNQNVKVPSQPAQDEKDSVQLLYVPLEHLQKQQNIDSGLLDEAFKSLQQQKLVAPPPKSDYQQKETESLKYQESLQHRPQPNIESNVNQQVYLTQQVQSSINDEKRVPQQYYVVQNNEAQKQPEPPRYYELVSKNQGELILKNNPKTVEVSSKQEYQVQAEKQQIVELTSPQPALNHQTNYNSPFENQQQTFQDSRTQGTRNFFKTDPQLGQSYVVQNQVSQPFSVEAPKLQQSYVVQNEPQAPIKQNFFTDDQKSRLQSIQKDILQQTLQVEKLQNQIQQGKSIDFQGKNNSQSPKKRKPHQPPLAVYMEGNQPGDVEAVLQVLKNAKSIAVQDQVGPNSPQVFIGPSNLNVPEGFAKFPLPYLSNLDNNRIQRKAQQFPFFVAPINYKEPEGYSKIPLPSPHVGSVVVSQFKQNQLPQLNDNFEESNRPVAITNYKFVNPSFQPSLDTNSQFDANLNAYSLESGNPRDNSNRNLKEQTLFQQITGFSGFEVPQSQYFNEGRPTLFEQIPETIPSTSRPSNEQYLEEVHRKPEVTPPENAPQEIPPRPTPGRQRSRGEKVRGNKKGGSILKESSIPEATTTERILPNPELTIPEVPTPNIVRVPEKVEISSQNPLTQDYLNRFSSNNNFNFNYVSSTPGYAIPSQSSSEELPANIRKLQPTQIKPNQHAIDAQFEQSIQSLQNSKERNPFSQEERKVHIYNQFEQFELPSQLTEINPNLPGLINELEQENLRTNPPISTTQSTTQYTVRTTEATTTTSTTTKRPRGRGRSRFNMKSTTPSYRRTNGERRRPNKTSTVTTTESSYANPENNQFQSERTRSRTRIHDSLTERVAEGSIESTSTSQQLLQPSTRVMDISQNQPNYYVEFQSSVDNVKPILRDYVEEPKTETVRFVEQYQSQKVTPAEEVALEEQPPIRQISVTQPGRSEIAKATPSPSTVEVEKTTRRRVRVRGRPKNKYSSTTIAPRATSPPEKEENEFYGFFRQPNFSQSSQIAGKHTNEEENIHIYAPTQQKHPVFHQINNEPESTTSQSSDVSRPRFVGEIRPKYASPSRGTTTQLPETTSKERVRGRVRVPGRSYERRTTTETSSTERNVRGRVRGKSHFTPPRNVRGDSDASETENYPAPFLKSREAATASSISDFKITVSADEDQNSHSEEPTLKLPQNGSKNLVYTDGYDTPDSMDIVSFRGRTRDDHIKKDGFKVTNLDQFDTAESQNYRSLLNSLDAPHKVNDLKSKEMEENSKEFSDTSSPSEPKTTTVPIEITTEETENDLLTTTEIVDTQKTPSDDLNSTILKSVRETIENSTVPIISTTQTPTETTTDLQETSREESTESDFIITTPEELKTVTSTETKTPQQTPLDLLNLQTSTSTEVSHETEICYKGRCVKSRNKKIRKRLLRKKVNETNN